jgi:hypothetical protein
MFAHYYANLDRGDIRVGASTSNSQFLPVAFRAPGASRVKTIIRALVGGTVTIVGLPAGRYALAYTTPSQDLVALPQRIVPVGGDLSVTIPSDGVISIVPAAPELTVQADTQSVSGAGSVTFRIAGPTGRFVFGIAGRSGPAFMVPGVGPIEIDLGTALIFHAANHAPFIEDVRLALAPAPLPLALGFHFVEFDLVTGGLGLLEYHHLELSP